MFLNIHSRIIELELKLRCIHINCFVKLKRINNPEPKQIKYSFELIPKKEPLEGRHKRVSEYQIFRLIDIIVILISERNFQYVIN